MCDKCLPRVHFRILWNKKTTIEVTTLNPGVNMRNSAKQKHGDFQMEILINPESPCQSLWGFRDLKVFPEEWSDLDQLQEMDSAGSLEGRYICIMHKGKRCVLRDSASKVKKKRLVKVGKYSQITKLLSENVQFPSKYWWIPMVFLSWCGFFQIKTVTLLMSLPKAQMTLVFFF